LPLETVRPFYLEDVVLSESNINPGDPDVVRKVEMFCAEKVSSLLDKAGIAIFMKCYLYFEKRLSQLNQLCRK